MDNKTHPVTFTPNNLCRTCMNASSDLMSLFDYIEIRNEKLQLNYVLLKCTSIEV